MLIGLLRLYKLALSPALMALGARCRHWPSCSSYAAEAIARHGAWAGCWMSLARLLRCRPWGTHGIDPPPAILSPTARWWAPWRYGDWRGPRNGPAAERNGHAEAHVS